MLNKRSFMTGTIGAAISAAAAQAQPAKPANGLNPPREIPHGMMKTTRMFKYPKGYGNGLAVSPEGLWIAEQKLSGEGALVDLGHLRAIGQGDSAGHLVLAQDFLEGMAAEEIQFVPGAGRRLGKFQKMNIASGDAGGENAVADEMELGAGHRG